MTDARLSDRTLEELYYMRPVHGALFARLRASLASFGLFFALYTAPAFAATPTTTTLTASSNNVVAGAVVTLTATVTNPGPVGQGTVLFCNASVSQCTQGRGLYGAVQLNSDGSAVLRLRFGSGVVNIQAKFTATRSNAGSTSLTSSIGVSSGPVYASSTSLAKAGSTGNYTLTGTVGGFGSGSLLGSVSFLDTSNGNAQVDSASLGSFSTSLSAPIPYSVGNGTTRALVADLNGDGILDVVEADYGDGTISVLLGNPDGTFQARHSYPAGSCSSPNWISMGDLNGDGIQDVVCNGQGNSTISVLLGNGDGSFRTGASYPLSIGPSSIAIGDFNGDGIQDLAITGNTSSTVAILLGNGDGTFQPQTTYPIGTYANSVAIGDFNGDGNLDLVVANSGSNTISVLLGNGDGTFQPQTTYATGSWPDALAVADFDGDGHLDIVVGSYSSNTVGVFIGNGDGTFQSQRGYAASGPVDVGVADLNGDGRPDLVVANYSTNTIATLLGNGDGTFKTAVTSPSGRSPASIAFGDFNGDGMLDVITPNNGGTPTVSVLFGDQSATFRVTGFSVSGSGTHNVLATYTGDATHTSSQSPTVALTAIVKTTPTVSVSCSPNPLTYGSQNSNCTVTVTGGSTPSGTVVWTINGGAWTSSSLFMGTDSESTFSTSNVGAYTVNVAYGGDGTHNPASGSTVLTITPSGPSILMWSAGNQFEPTASLSLAPVTAGNANGVTAQAFGGNSPTGTVAFGGGGTSYATLPLQSVSTTNLLLQSNGMSSGWTPSSQVLTLDAGQAPDGTSTAASLVSNGGDNQFWQVASTGNISGQTYTASIWVKGIGSTIGKGGRIWLIPSDWSVVSGCDVPITANWERVSCTVQYGLGYSATQMITRYDLPRYGEAAGDTVFVWGPQLEASASVGPYVPTTTAAATSSQPVATAGSYVTSPGVYTVTAAYGGDGSNTAASGSVDLTAVAATPLSVISVSPTTAAYGSAVSMTASISTGGNVPTGTVNFASDGSNVVSAAPTSATTTNYIPYSRDFTKWTWEATNPTSVTQGTIPGPNGLPGDVATVIFPTTTGTYSGIRYTDSTTNLVGKTMTFSFWVRGDVPSSISFWLADWPYSGNFAAGNGCSVTTTWQRCTVSGTFPSNANGGFYVPFRSDNQGSPIKIYVWGPQLNEGAAGPYVSTAGTARTASGGVATGSVSTLAVGTHAMTAAVTADPNVNAATSAAVTETVTRATPVVTLTCSPTTITYGGTPSTCTSSVTSGATGTNAWSINGPWTTTSSLNTSYQIGIGNPVGTDTVGVAYSGDANYNAATASSVVVTINQASQTITFTGPTSPVTYGVAPITLTASATSGLGVTFTVVSGPGSISVSTLTITGVGTVVVAANQAGNSNFLPAGQATQSLTVNSGVMSTTLAVLPSNSVVAGTVVTLTATVKNPTAVTQGVVLFCNALAAHCSQGLGRYGAVSLSTSGTAVLKMKLPVGVNNVQAVFVATSVNAASTSSSTAVTVAASPIYASSTTLAYGGVPGNYNLGGFVTAYGGQVFGSSVALLDTTNGNAQIATSALSLPYFQYTQTMNPTASRSWSSVVGDFNGDGIPDLAVATYTGNALDILIGNGDGTFRAAVPYALTSAASSVVVGDFNGDGKLDLAVANWQTNDISIFIGVGNGTFLPQVKYAVGIEPTSISVGDFNRDGIMDLAVTNQVGNTVSILIGQGDGTFKPQVTYATGPSPYSVTCGDFNEDGKIALAVANYGGSTISVLLGNGDGTFLTQVPYTVGTAPSAVTTGDFNNDGHLDLAVANSGSNTASILIGHGDGTFSAAVSYPTGTIPMSVSAGDFNNDGALDLITGNSGSDTVSLLLGTGSGTFGAQSTVAGGYSYHGLAVGDFNGDGLLDFAANQNGGTATELVFLGQLRESFNVTGVSILGSGTHNILASFLGDAIRTASQSATAPLTATKLTPVLTWAGPSGIMYGTPLSATQLNATSGGVAGALAYTPVAGAIIPAGLQTLSVTFTPTDTTTYNSATTTVTIVVNKVTPVLTWANPTAITYGTALSATQLNATSGGVAGTFGYTPASDTVLTSGSHTLSVTFTPTDTTDYNNSSAIATLFVNKVTLTVTPNTASRPYGAANPAFFGSITGMVAGDGITATYASGATVTTTVDVYSSGANAIASTLQDPNGRLGNYNVTKNLGALTITQATATMNLTSSLNPSKYGDSVTFTVTATGVAGAANPTGTVTVSDGGTTLATITLDASGTATQSIQTLTAGSHSLSAFYGGDGNYK